MRQILLDTETTGLDPRQGHKLIEVAALEMVNRRLTGRYFHRYVNPEREIDSEAQNVHGISREMLEDKPRFADVADEFVEFIRDAELIIHNAPFDVGFLNAEFAHAQRPPLAQACAGVVDTLAMAKALHPGQRNNLDALCKRYGVDNTARTLHGALIDCELLAAVYLALTRGQESLSMGLDDTHTTQNVARSTSRPRVRACVADADALAAHAATLEAIDKESRGQCLWLPRPEAG
jgi:DNA polymerase-3 subunit epsilon